MESWRKVWRQGLVPLLSTRSLEALRVALLTDDKRLIQGATTEPPPLDCGADWPCEGACLVGFIGLAEGLETVGDIEELFASLCKEVDDRIGEPAGVRHLLNYFDGDTGATRQEVFRELLAECDLALASRTQGQAEEPKEMAG